MIELNQVGKCFTSGTGKPLWALNGIDLRIARGEICALIGHSGAGKSTLLRCLSGLEELTTGEVYIDGQPMKSLSKSAHRDLNQSMAVVFQGYHLLSNRSVLENVAFPLMVKGEKKSTYTPKAIETLKRVGLEDKIDAYPSELSGGQKQRVAIARALVTEPRILLLDEPTSALDPQSTSRILHLIADLGRELQLAILLISHDIEAAQSISHQVALMENGRIVAQGSNPEFFQTCHAAQAFAQNLRRQVPEKIAAEVAA